jgi:hypothetical protein
MKKFLLITLILYAAGFAATAVAHAAGYLRFNAFTAVSIATALIAAAIVPIACSNQLRVRRSSSSRESAAEQPDSASPLPVSLRPWTYQTHGTSS